MPEQGKNPVIIVSESTWMAAGVFNPNDWTGDSVGIIQSCSTEYGVLLHCRDQIVKACEGSADLCAGHIRTLQEQWRTKRFDLSRIEAFAEIPQVHVQIEAFLSVTKTLLDLVVQLLASEGIVSASVHGFHEKGTKVLKTLSNNATAQRKVTATQIERLISAHKEIWIDKAIAARDDLTHPQAGFRQLMFRLELSEASDGLHCDQIIPPTICSTPVDQYASGVVLHAEEFIRDYLKLLRGGS